MRFETMKQIISKDTRQSLKDFSQLFDIHNDLSHTQKGAVLLQHNNPIAIYSRKLNPAQTQYTSTVRLLNH
jgi:RNase H-like domain found in reverse transcriptase